jgi:hypothetical protein
MALRIVPFRGKRTTESAEYPAVAALRLLACRRPFAADVIAGLICDLLDNVDPKVANRCRKDVELAKHRRRMRELDDETGGA